MHGTKLAESSPRRRRPARIPATPVVPTANVRVCPQTLVNADVRSFLRRGNLIRRPRSCRIAETRRAKEAARGETSAYSRGEPARADRPARVAAGDSAHGGGHRCRGCVSARDGLDTEPFELREGVSIHRYRPRSANGGIVSYAGEYGSALYEMRPSQPALCLRTVSMSSKHAIHLMFCCSRRARLVDVEQPSCSINTISSPSSSVRTSASVGFSSAARCLPRNSVFVSQTWSW